jgi:nucleoside 2-deoxyribosyltransferase
MGKKKSAMANVDTTDFERQMLQLGPDSLLPDWGPAIRKEINRRDMGATRKVYLAGGIFGLADRGQTWRVQTVSLLPKGWQAINPNLVELDKTSPAELIRGDYAAILACQAIIARVEEPSWGTAMELVFAKRHDIPVIGWRLVYGAISPWLDYHLTILCHSIEDAAMELKHVGVHHNKL